MPELIHEKPEQVLAIITGETSVFEHHDVARTLHRYINDDPQEFQSAFAKAMASPALVKLQPERADPATGETELVRYSTREKALLTFDTHWKSAESMIRAAFHDPDEVPGRLGSAIIDQGGDGKVMAKAITA